MDEEKASAMNKNIGKRVRYYIIFFVVLILFLIWSNNIVGLVTQSIAGDKEKSEFAQKIIGSVITAISAFALILINLGRDIDFHNLIDRFFFGVREKTGDIIYRKMIEASKLVDAKGWQNMSDKKKEVTYLFYHFVNQQPQLRSLAFTYWEQYFVNIYAIVFAFLGFIISLVIVLFRWKFDFTVLLPFIFLVILIAISLSTRFSLVKKIYDLPVQQIEEIRSSNGAELRAEVEQRFGSIV